MFRNMVTSLLKHDRIKTTEAKAKELRRWADQIITLAKRGDLHARRQALSIVREKNVVHKIFEEAGERFGSINGGYTRIIKIGRRAGDAAVMTMIELVSAEDITPRKPKKSKPAAQESAPVAQPDEADGQTQEEDAAAADVGEVQSAAEEAGDQPEVEASSDEGAAQAQAETEDVPEDTAEEKAPPKTES